MTEIIKTLLLGLLMGLCISAPIGPVGALCIRRTIFNSRRQGILTGVGATLGDLFYGVMAYLAFQLGLKSIEDWLGENQFLMQNLSIVFVILVGIFIIKKSFIKIEEDNIEDPISQVGLSPLNIIATSLGMSLINPLALMGFFIYYYGYYPQEPETSAWLVFIVSLLSIGAGAMLWWYLLTSVLLKLKKRVSEKSIHLFNRAVGVFVLIFGAGYGFYVWNDYCDWGLIEAMKNGVLAWMD